jgi:hypothetical protein
MGRKLVRDNELLQSGGLLSFPRTGCALRAPVILSRGQRSRHYGRTSPAPAQRPRGRARSEPENSRMAILKLGSC